MSSFTKSLFRLTVVTFIFAMLMPVTTTRANPGDANGCHKHKEECGVENMGTPKYTVTLSGALTSIGEHDGWSEPTSGKRSIDLDSHIDPMSLDLTFFLSVGEGELCFVSPPSGSVTTTDVLAGITKRNIKGGIKQAWAGFLFAGVNNTGQPLNYLLEIFGTFSDHESWPSTNTLTMTEWEITTSSGAGDAAQGACISEGLFDDPNTLVVEGVVMIDVQAHADAVHP